MPHHFRGARCDVCAVGPLQKANTHSVICMVAVLGFMAYAVVFPLFRDNVA